MNLSIVLYGSSVLRKHADEITAEDKHRQFVKNLFDTLKNNEGIGLAGPQIGILKRIFVISTLQLPKNDKSIEKFEQAFINPQIIWQSPKMNIYKEGCLSIPGIFENVSRPEKIKVRYNDLDFNIIEENISGLKARIFQHEYDHLNGILFIDKIGTLKRILLSSKLNQIAKSFKNLKT